MIRLFRLLLLLTAVLLLSATNAQASTDEQRLAAHLHTAESYFLAPCERVVHLHGEAAIDAQFPIASGEEVLGMAEGCEIWIRSGLDQDEFRETLFHEIAHTAGWDHSPAMDAAVEKALSGESFAVPSRPVRRRARAAKASRAHDRNRRQGSGRIPR